MDLVALLEDAAAHLPSGEHSQGVRAIIRHVKSAIRHLERDQQADPDTFTDAIYRTNQAYEGSLKEAFRVLADQEPGQTTPFDIENYLENNSVVRPRVLTQLSRYRKDYRNPSNHDYKLDFDRDEALLAIVSVCGFALLLFDQIKSKIAANAAQGRAGGIMARSILQDDDLPAGEKIARLCFEFWEESGTLRGFDLARGVADFLKSVGYDAKVSDTFYSGTDGFVDWWDISVTTVDGVWNIDCRTSGYGDEDNPTRIEIYEDVMDAVGSLGGIVLFKSDEKVDYVLISGELGIYPVYIIAEAQDETGCKNIIASIANARQSPLHNKLSVGKMP